MKALGKHPETAPEMVPGTHRYGNTGGNMWKSY